MQTQHEKSTIVQVAEGKIPSNAQINGELEATKQFLGENEIKAESLKQKEILQDTQLLVEAAQETLQNRNYDEKVQRLIADLKTMELNSINFQREGVTKEISEFSGALREFVITLVKSPNFRTHLLSFLTLIKDIVNYQKPVGVTDAVKQNLIEQQQPLKETVIDTVKQFKEAVGETQWVSMPLEHRERLRNHFKELLKQISAQPQARKAFKGFLRVLSLLRTQLYVQFEAAKSNQTVKTASIGAKHLVEEFTQGRSLDLFLERLKSLLFLIQKDNSFWSFYLNDLRNHIEKGLDDPNFAATDEYLNQTEALLQNGQYLTNKYYDQSIFQDIITEAEILLESMKNDEMVELLRRRVKKLVKDFHYTDSRGHAHLDMEAVSLMRTMIVPFLVERIKEIPVPRIEISNSDFEYLIVDDLFLGIGNIVPDKVKIRVFNDLSLKNNLTDMNAMSQMQLIIKGVEVAVKDFYFTFKRKKMISISDEGRADLFITRGGLDLFTVFDIKTSSNSSIYLTAKKMNVFVHKLKIDIKDAKHKALLNIVTSMFSGAIERQIQKTVEQKLLEMGNDLAELINTQVVPKIQIPFGERKERVQEQVSTM